MRLAVSLLLMTIGGSGMYGIAVALAPVQAEFGVTRGDASLPYTLTMLGFGIGGILMGRLADRFGVMVPVMIGALGLGGGFVLAGVSGNLTQFALAHGFLIGLLGCSTTFAPLVADTSLWFNRRRGIAVAICASGNYLAGAVWPPILQHFTATQGWRPTMAGVGVFCALTMLPLALALRRRSPVSHGAGPMAGKGDRPAGSPGRLQAALIVAGLSCCVAMSMPQVHIVAYASDLGYGAARGAEMLAAMMGFGIISRIACGFLADRIGSLLTLLLGSVLQGFALFLYLWFDGLVSLYVISALFGLFQGGIVPSYALIVREHFSPTQAGARVGTVLMATLLGMALGGWMSGAIFDLTGSYQAAFLNGIAFNLLNIGIVLFLLKRARGTGAGHARARVAPI